MNRQILLLLLLIISTIFSGCNDGSVLHNQNMSPKIKKEINNLNKQVIQGIKDNKSSLILNLMIEKIRKENPDSTKNIISKIHKLSLDTEFKLYDDYYVLSDNNENVITVTNKEKSYYLKYKGMSNETFICLYRLEEADREASMFTTIYTKIEGEWKLQYFHYGGLEVLGKTAPELFDEIKDLSNKGYELSAVLRLDGLAKILRPNPFFHYINEKEIVDFSRNLRYNLDKKYKFPIKLSNIKTKPIIYSINPIYYNNQDSKEKEFIFEIIYITNIPLENKKEIEAEVDRINKELEKVFPGITKVERGIMYKAVAEPPTKEDNPCYSVVVHFNN
ncbi:hypothetical protein BX659_11977 [Orenia metallireducens]|uniref:Lipoprotein n=1 Tax=Orenia metallireducens TaxID=1413210 RepID=A0A285HKR2_9FIRM|nr:hypothetical protein [Orenia metallireducens]PRX26713.1 hypothetical protein BX659_11977 [Orenia metallireducens]SNY36329.1 hypothetical protein SAMN06265827_12077 [Orenia metallireducens]